MIGRASASSVEPARLLKDPTFLSKSAAVDQRSTELAEVLPNSSLQSSLAIAIEHPK